MLLDIEIFKSIVFWAIINFIVLFTALYFILFKRVTNLMEKRSKLVQDQLDFAAKSREEAIELKEQQEVILKQAQEEANRIIEQAVAEAQKQAEKIVTDAQQQALQLLENAKREFEIEKKKQLNQLKNQFVSLSLLAASKLIEKNLSSDENKKMVEEIFDKAGVA